MTLKCKRDREREGESLHLSGALEARGRGATLGCNPGERKRGKTKMMLSALNSGELH